jgi:hypothetical protein
MATIESAIYDYLTSPLSTEKTIRYGLVSHWSFDASDGTDNSGNGNTLTLFGTPTFPAGLSGNGIELDGATQYGRTDSVLATVPDVWHFHCSCPFGNAVVVAASQAFFNYKAASATVGFIIIRRPANSDSLSIDYTDGANLMTESFLAFFTGYSATRIDIGVQIDFTAGTAKAYRNDAQFSTTRALTTPEKPDPGSYLYFGTRQNTGMYVLGILDEPRVYSRALTNLEITYLFSNPTQWGINAYLSQSIYDISAYVGTDIYLGALPDGIVSDCIRYQIVSPSNEPYAFGSTNCAQPRIQFDIFSKSAANALAIGNFLATAFNRFQGAVGYAGNNVIFSTASGPMVMRDTSDEQWWHGVVFWNPEYER